MRKNVLLIVLAVLLVAESAVIAIDQQSRDSELDRLRASDHKRREVCNYWSIAVENYGMSLVREPVFETSATPRTSIRTLLSEQFLTQCDMNFPKFADLLDDADTCWLHSGGRGDCYAKVVAEFDKDVPIYLW